MNKFCEFLKEHAVKIIISKMKKNEVNEKICKCL